MENLSPELAYATKGNIAYPTVGASAASIAGLAQNRFADSGGTGANIAQVTTQINASVATTTLAIAGGLPQAAASGQVVAVAVNGQCVTTALTSAAAAGATSLAVSSFTVPWAIPVGADVVVSNPLNADWALALPASNVHVVLQ